MANDGADIDLYADDLEFNQETNEFNDQNVDLYDDVITASGKNSNANTNSLNEDEFSQTQDSNNTQTNEFHSTNEQPHHHTNSSSTKKIGIYVGNLTWWTTDQDIVQAINGIGINDIIEVKFFENRANGQSKGFCVVSLGSESSVKNVIDKLPKTEIHSQNPVVTVCNKQNLNHFEMQSRKNNPGHANNNNNNNNMNNMGNMNNGPGNHNMRPPFGANNPMGMPNAGHNMRPPLINRPQRPNGPLLSSQPRMPMVGPPQGGPPYNPGMQNQNLWNHPQNMGPQSNNPSGPGNRGRGPMHNSPQGPRQGHNLGGPPPGNMGGPRMPGNVGGMQRNTSQPLLRAPTDRVGHNGQMGGSQDWDSHNTVGMNMPSGGPMNQQNPMDMHGPAPHVNPAFFGGQPQDPYNRSSSSSAPYGSNDYGRPHISSQTSGDSMMSQVSENEFEELMSKNRHVSSNAITRAVSDASVGDFSSAIETLVTAISLIKQSKVSSDERCKILISSLQDTLHGIETKSYSMSRKERPKSRDRSRERRDKRRDRSRSRDREYRSRSREKDRRGRDSYRSRDSKYRDRSREKYKS